MRFDNQEVRCLNIGTIDPILRFGTVRYMTGTPKPDPVRGAYADDLLRCRRSSDRARSCRGTDPRVHDTGTPEVVENRAGFRAPARVNIIVDIILFL